MNLYGMSANPWTRFADTPLLVTSKACREAVLSMTCESKRDHVHPSGDVPSHGLAMKGPDLTNRVGLGHVCGAGGNIKDMFGDAFCLRKVRLPKVRNWARIGNMAAIS